MGCTHNAEPEHNKNMIIQEKGGSKRAALFLYIVTPSSSSESVLSAIGAQARRKA